MPPAAGIVIDQELIDPPAIGRGDFHSRDRSAAAGPADLISPASAFSSTLRPFRPFPLSPGRHQALSDDRRAVGLCRFDAARAARCRATLS